VLNDFFCIGEDDRWTHSRCDAEITHFRQKSEKASNAGKASAQRRSNGRSTDAQQTFNQPITNNQEPITNNQDKSPKGDTSCGDDLTVKDVVEAWNDLAVDRGLPKVSKVTEARRRQVQARIKEYPDAGDWSKALSSIDKSKFLCGDNDRGWRANFDFLLQPSTFIKLLEGTYDR